MRVYLQSFFRCAAIVIIALHGAVVQGQDDFESFMNDPEFGQISGVAYQPLITLGGVTTTLTIVNWASILYSLAQYGT